MSADFFFAGCLERCVDDKNRLILPPQFGRENLEKKYLVLVKIEDAHAIAVFDAISFSALPPAQRKALAPFAYSAKLDSHNRFLIPENYRGALFKKSEDTVSRKLVLVGCGKYFEIWAKEKWEQEEKPKRAKRAASALEEIIPANP